MTIVSDGRDNFVGDEVVIGILHGGALEARDMGIKPRAPSDTIARVDFKAACFDQGSKGAHHQEAFAFFGISACGGKEQKRLSVIAKASDEDVLVEACGVPTRGQFVREHATLLEAFGGAVCVVAHSTHWGDISGVPSGCVGLFTPDAWVFESDSAIRRSSKEARGKAK